jgi:hypothetical protein
MKQLLSIVALLSFILIVPTSTSAAISTQIIMNDTLINTGIPPQIIKDRTYVPLRAIAEGLGSKISWDSNQRKVTVEKSQLKPLLILLKAAPCFPFALLVSNLVLKSHGTLQQTRFT